MKGIFFLHRLLCLLAMFIDAPQAHVISKRAINDKELYVLVNRDDGCKAVDSIEPCPISWKLSPFPAKFYYHQSKMVSAILNVLEMSKASDECKNAAKTTLCGQAAPKCSDADGSEDYGDVDAACPKIYSSCPSEVADSFRKQKLCDKVLSRRIAKPKCVTPPKIEGNCPQPKYKMPTDALFFYQRNSADNATVDTLKQLNVSSKCLAEMEELQCMPIYCSDDEKYLLTSYLKQDCANTTKHCVSDPLEPLMKSDPIVTALKNSMEEACDVYPDAGAAELKTQAPPATVGTARAGATWTPSKLGPIGAGNVHLGNCFVLLFSFILVFTTIF